MTAAPNPPGSLLRSNLGLKVKTSILIDFMVSLGIQKNKGDFNSYENNDFTSDGHVISNYPSKLNTIFEEPPLETVSTSDGLSKKMIQNTVETIYLNILLNSKEYPEIFALINDFGPGYWKDLYESFKSNRSGNEVIHLGQ